MDKLKKALDMFNSLLPAIKNTLIIAAVVLVAILINDFKNKDVLDGFINESKQHEKDAKVALHVSDSLKLEVAKHQKIADIAQGKIVVLEGRVERTQASAAANKKQVDSLKHELKDSTNTLRDTVNILLSIVPKQDSIIAHKDVVIALRTTEVRLLEGVVAQKDSSIAKLMQARDTLRTTVVDTPVLGKNPNKLFGFIPLPTRKTTLVVGFISGVIATGVVLR